MIPRERSERPVDRMVIRWEAMIVFCVLIVVVFGFAFHANSVDMQRAQEQEAALQQTLNRLQNDQLELTGQIKQVGTTSYIETRAREDYAFLKPGELRFEIVNPEVLEGYTTEELQILMDEMTMYE